MNGTTARVILVTGLLVATSWPSQVALAKTIKPFRVGGWAGGAVVDDQTKKFVHCSASLSNSRNTSISYTLNERYSWQLSLSNSVWNFSPGFGLVVAVRVNDRLIPNQPAIFTSNQTLQLQLADSVSAFEMLQVTRKIQVETRGIQLDFELMENNDVLAALVDCVNQQTGRGKYAKLNARAKRTSASKACRHARCGFGRGSDCDRRSAVQQNSNSRMASAACKRIAARMAGRRRLESRRRGWHPQYFAVGGWPQARRFGDRHC